MSAKWLRLLWLALGAGAVMLLAPLLGGTPINLQRALDFSIPRADNYDAILLFDLRFARVIFAAVVGAALGVAGCAFQVALRNPLATPYTLGVSSAASLGALLVLLVLGPGWFVVVGGLTAGLLCTGLVLVLARMLSGWQGTVSLLLAGVTLNTLFGAAILLLQYLADPTQTFTMIRWLMGALDVAGMQTGLLLGAACGAVMVAMILQTPAMNLLTLDDLSARTLGIDPDRTRIWLMMLASVLAALVVSFAGPIGFVGLIVPQAARRVLGEDHRVLLPSIPDRFEIKS